MPELDTHLTTRARADDASALDFVIPQNPPVLPFQVPCCPAVPAVPAFRQGQVRVGFPMQCGLARCPEREGTPAKPRFSHLHKFPASLEPTSVDPRLTQTGGILCVGSLTGCCDWLLTGLTQVLNLRARSRMQQFDNRLSTFAFVRTVKDQPILLAPLRQGFSMRMHPRVPGALRLLSWETLDSRSWPFWKTDLDCCPTCGAPR